jgi:hypothetical protein
MRSRIALFIATFVLGVATFTWAQTATPTPSGTVVRVDPQSSVVVLDDGRMFRVTPNTVVIVDNRPTTFATLRTGDRVMIQSGEPVMYREGRYVAVPPGAAVVTQAPPGGAAVVTQAPPVAGAPTPVIVQTPPGAATGMPVGVRQTVYGKVTDVDGNGEVKIKTDRDSFEVRVSPDALRHIKKGDNVVIDLTISPPGAASPR